MVAYDTRHLDTTEDKVKFVVDEAHRDAELLTRRLREQHKHLPAENNPIHLKYEKVCYPYMCQEQKNYMSYIRDPPKEAGPDIKGRIKKRSLCPYVRQMALDAVLILLKEPDMPVDKAARLVQERLNAFLAGEVPESQMVITTSLSKPWQEYYQDTRGNAMVDHGIVHAKLAERMYNRDPGSAPGKGDRVRYMYAIMPRPIEGPTGKGEAGHVETPEYMEKHNIPVDRARYVDKQFQTVIEFIFQYVSDKPLEFLDSSRNISLKVERRRSEVADGQNAGRRKNGSIMEDYFFKGKRKATPSPPPETKAAYEYLLETGIAQDQGDIDAIETARQRLEEIEVRERSNRAAKKPRHHRLVDTTGKVKMFMSDEQEDEIL
jgi:hypothetical protein